MRDVYWHSIETAALAIPGGAPRASLPASLRALFGRRVPAQPEPQARAEAAPCPAECRLRASAHAAFRAVDGGSERALDAALDVMENEIARLRAAVEEYGEALKTIEVYGADPSSRLVASSARRAAPCALRAAPPVPRGMARHG